MKSVRKLRILLACVALALTPLSACSVPQAEAAPANRLVGVGCGPDRVTMAAVEEDEFPGTCDAIGKPEEFGCRADDTPDFCVAYLGRDGW